MGANPEKLIIILVIVLILFGGQKIPEMMRGLGQGMKEFKKATRDEDDDRALPTTAAVPTVTVPTSTVPPVSVPTNAPPTHTPGDQL